MINWKEILKHTTAPSLAVVMLGFALAPLPGVEQNPTGFKLFVYDAMSARWSSLWAQTKNVHDNVSIGNNVQYLQYQKDRLMDEYNEIAAKCSKEDADAVRCRYMEKKWDIQNKSLDKELEYNRNKHTEMAENIEQMFARHP